MKVENLKTYCYNNFYKHLYNDLKCNVFIAGGCIRDLLSDMPVKDYDIFCRSIDDVPRVLHCFVNAGATITFDTEKFTNLKFKDMTLQIIKSFTYPGYKEVINSFDFTICQAVVFCKREIDDLHEKEIFVVDFYCHDKFFEDVLTKSLQVSNLPFPVDSLRRAFRFNEKGYKPCKETIFKLATAIHDMDNEQFDNLQKFQYYVVD